MKTMKNENNKQRKQRRIAMNALPHVCLQNQSEK